MMQEAGLPQRHVSILAPRIRGAQHMPEPLRTQAREFQSSPPEFGGRNSGGLVGHGRIIRFQSSPPEFGGRNLEATIQPADVNLFQSSPPEFGGRNNSAATRG